MADVRSMLPFLAPHELFVGGFSVGTHVLDANNDAVQFIFSSHPGGATITKCAVRWGALTGTSPTYRLSLQGVSAGVADGTIKSGSGSNDVFVTAQPAAGVAGTTVEYTFGGGGYDPTPGEMLALVVDYSAGTIDASNNWSIGYKPVDTVAWGLPCPVLVAAGTPTRYAKLSIFGVFDGAWYGGTLRQSLTYSTVGSSPASGGLKFTVPAAVAATVACSGLCFYASALTAGKTFRFTLYDSSDSVLRQKDFVTADFYNAQMNNIFWEPVALTCGSTYRVAVTSTDGGTMRWHYYTYADAAHKDCESFGQAVDETEGGVGDWTDYTDRKPWASIILSDITEPAAGGGLLRHPGMMGGING